MAHITGGLESQDTKQLAHELVDRLEPGQVSVAIRLLERVVDPIAYALANAPVDDETPSDDEERSAAASAEWLKQHDPLPNEEILKMLGLTRVDRGQANSSSQPVDKT